MVVVRTAGGLITIEEQLANSRAPEIAIFFKAYIHAPSPFIAAT